MCGCHITANNNHATTPAQHVFSLQSDSEPIALTIQKKNVSCFPSRPTVPFFHPTHPFYLLCFSNNCPFFTILHEPFQFLVVVCCQLFSTATSPCQVQCPRNNTSDRPSTQLCRNTRTYPLVSISLSSNVFARPRPPPQHHTMLIHIARNQNADVPARHVLLHVQPPCPISPLAICD